MGAHNEKTTKYLLKNCNINTCFDKHIAPKINSFMMVGRLARKSILHVQLRNVTFFPLKKKNGETSA